jgi:hypothetical protein
MSLIPKESTIHRMIDDIQEWHTLYRDWRKARKLLEDQYGYEKYGGGCHIVPNHGLIILSSLYGNDDFQKSLMIVNTSGWIDRKTYNPRWAGKSSNVVTIETIEVNLPLILGHAEQIP